MSSSVGQALLLTLLGAAGTALGGLLVVVQPTMSFKRLGMLQGLAGGLMLSLSILDLLPEAVEEIGFVAANTCFYLGVLFFAAVVALIPEPDSLLAKHTQPAAVADPASVRCKANGQAQHSKETATVGYGTGAAFPANSGAAIVRGRPALSRTASGGAENVAVPRASSRAGSPVAASLPAPHTPPVSGTCRDSLQHHPSSPKPESAGTSAVTADLDVVLDDVDSRDNSARLKRQLLMSGLITAVGIALHNFPEGVAVFLAAQKSHAIGVSLAIAIALHNIPEGVAVALPVYFATGSRMQGLKAAVLSGLAEPLAVLLIAILFPAAQLDKHVVDAMLAGVGGIMAFLAFHELLPLSLQHAGQSLAVACFFVGMALMSFNLHVLKTYIMPGFH